MRVAHFVQSVIFTDGTKWEMPGGYDYLAGLWLRSKPQDDPPLACESSQDVPGAMSNLRGTSFRDAGLSTHADESVVTQYQIECSLPPGGELASCPF